MYETRQSLYREVADTIVLVDHRSPNEVADAVLR
jgi:shikimate kinase